MRLENSVELLGWYGGDLTIAMSAWTSTKRDMTPEKLARVEQLLTKTLWAADPVPHKTPFEKGIVHFLVNTDIATHIHLLKHRIASINAESARYKELVDDKYYLPDDWIGIPMSDGILINGQTVTEWIDALEQYTKLGNELYHKCIRDLTPFVGRKRAKETARFFKTYNSQLTCDIMFNMSSFHNFITQRMDSHAQLEIREIAEQMVEQIKQIEGNPFEYTLKAWGL
jgi:flavin-dependent thymidylate synthase